MRRGGWQNTWSVKCRCREKRCRGGWQANRGEPSSEKPFTQSFILDGSAQASFSPPSPRHSLIHIIQLLSAGLLTSDGNLDKEALCTVPIGSFALWLMVPCFYGRFVFPPFALLIFDLTLYLMIICLHHPGHIAQQSAQHLNYIFLIRFSLMWDLRLDRIYFPSRILICMLLDRWYQNNNSVWLYYQFTWIHTHLTLFYTYFISFLGWHSYVAPSY